MTLEQALQATRETQPQQTLRFISLFAGIGGFDLGFERAGMECVAQVEWDKQAQAVLSSHFPEVARFEDIRDVGQCNLPNTDVLCGGFPCQDVSLAGERSGLQGNRSTLWTEFYRLIRDLKPRWVVVENVVGLLSSDDGRFFGTILRDLSTSGFDAEWEVLPAAVFGAPQRRERVFIVAYRSSTGKSAELEPSREGRTPLEFGGFYSNPPEYDSRQWKSEPESPMVRVADGVPAELDARIKQLGNAVVPQVAEWIGRRIVELDGGLP